MMRWLSSAPSQAKRLQDNCGVSKVKQPEQCREYLYCTVSVLPSCLSSMTYVFWAADSLSAAVEMWNKCKFTPCGYSHDYVHVSNLSHPNTSSLRFAVMLRCGQNSWVNLRSCSWKLVGWDDTYSGSIRFKLLAAQEWKQEFPKA